jgi:chemotaxis response regulator CheB
MKATLANKKVKSPAKRIMQDNIFQVVAIGASAGGLGAVTQLLKDFTANKCMPAQASDLPSLKK